MTAQRNPDRLIEAFLDEGPAELRNSSYDSVRTEIEQTRQRVALGPWREQPIMKAAWLAAATAVVVAVVAAIGLQLLPTNDFTPSATLTSNPDLTASPNAEPTTPPVAAAPLPSLDLSLASGTYVIGEPWASPSVTVSVPAGWSTTDDGVLTKGGLAGDVELSNVLFHTHLPTQIYDRACQWQNGAIVVRNAEQALDLLSNQADNAATPTIVEDTSLGGVPVTMVELSAQAVDSECHDGFSLRWNIEGGGWGAHAGQVDRVYVVDIGAEPMFVVGSIRPRATEQEINELNQIIESVQFGTSE